MYFLDRLKEAQQFQLVNIFIQYIKNYIYILIYSKIALGLIDNTAEQTNCSTAGRYYVIIVENGSICFIIFNLIALVYIIRQQDFARLEFFIMYGLNLGWFTVVLIYSLITVISREYECNTIIIFRKAFLFVCIKKEIEIGALIFKQSDGFLRQVNICANTVFAFMIFTSPDQERCSKSASTIVLSITIENIVSLIFFTVVNACITCFSLKNQAFKAVKFVSIVILSSFVLSYIVIMYFNATGDIPFSEYCIPIIFAMKSYTYVIPISLLSMGILYYSLLLQYKSEEQQEEKDNYKSRFSINQRFSLQQNPQFTNQNSHNYQNGDGDNRKTISNHMDLEKLYKSGQQQNNQDKVFGGMGDASAQQMNSNHNLIKQNQQNTNFNNNQIQDQPKMNERSSQEKQDQQQFQNFHKQNNNTQIRFQGQNSSISNKIQTNNNQSSNHINQNLQHHNIHSQQHSIKIESGSNGSLVQSIGGVTPSFQQQLKRSKDVQF